MFLLLKHLQTIQTQEDIKEPVTKKQLSIYMCSFVILSCEAIVYVSHLASFNFSLPSSP